MKKQILSEVKHFQKLAGLLNENWHPDDPASVDMDDMEDVDPDDYDDVSEDANTQGRTSYDLVKGPNEDLLVKRILVNLHNKYGKDGYHYDPYMNRLTIYGEAGEDKVIVDMLSALFDQPEYQDLSEDDYSENPTPNDDESESGDTDAMGGIDEGEGENMQPKYTVGTKLSSFSASWKVVEVYNNFTELEQKDPENAEMSLMVRLHNRDNKKSEEELRSQPWYGMKGTSMMSRSNMIDYKPQSALDNMTVDK